MKRVIFLLTALLLSCCIPYSKAPHIEGTRVQNAKEFKGNLPNRNALVFENPYGLACLHAFLKDRFSLASEGEELPEQIPFEVNGHPYYLSVFSSVRYTRALNLFGGIVYEFLTDDEVSELLVEEDPQWAEDFEAGYLYGVFTVTDEYGRDALDGSHPENNRVLNYLRVLHYDLTDPDIKFKWENDPLHQ